MNDDSRFAVCRDVRYRVVEEEAVVLRQGPGEVLILNEVGARVLQLVAEGKTLGGVVALLLGEYEVERDVLRGDVERFLDDSVAAGLVEPVVSG